jgi:Sulfatase
MARESVPLRGLHLGVLYALAVSQPLLNLLGNNADFFTSRQLTSGKVVWFALVVGLLIPLALYAIDTAAGLINDGVGWVVHLVLIFGLGLLLTAQIARKIFEASVPAIALAAILAGLLTLIYARSRPLRQIATYFSPLPLLVLALFLFNTPVHKIVFPGSTAAADVAVNGNTPVVFLSFDEFTGTTLLGPDNKIDAKVFPNFAALTKDATYYRNYTAATDETTRGMAALLTGDMWHKGHPLPIAAEYPHNLFTLFGSKYRMRVSEEATDMCPVKLCHEAGASSSSVLNDAGLVYLHQIAPKRLEKKLTPVNETLGKFTGEGKEEKNSNADTPAKASRHGKNQILHELGGGGRPQRFEQWLKTVDGKVDRTLYFKHVLLPHVPWQYLPTGQMYRTHAQEYINGINQTPSFGDRWLLQQGYQRHVMQAAFVDKLVGQLVARLKAVGIYDKALIVITADNGESFLHPNHDRHVADAATYTDIASTPLLIKLPGGHSGGYDDRHVSTFDVVPTVAAAAGLSMPWRVDGQSILRHGDPHPVSVHREQGFEGRVFTTSLANYDRARRQALARKSRLFRNGVYGIGPEPDLIGKAVTDVGGELVPAKAQLNSELSKDLNSVDPAGSFVPANLAGRISGLKRGKPLALAVNGTVRAVGWSAQLKGDKHVYFSFFVPPTSFKKGKNEVRVYRIGP